MTYADLGGLNGPVITSDTIAYQGFNASRIIKIQYANMSTALATGESEQSLQTLFPSLNGDTSIFDPTVVSSVTVLKPDNTVYLSYQFTYNRYGELAGVNLPTGGGFQYKWAARCPSSNPGCDVIVTGDSYNEAIIGRRIIERDVLRETGTLEGITTYTPVYCPPTSSGSYPTSCPPANTVLDSTRSATIVTATHRDATNSTTLATEVHSFFGDLSDPSAYMPFPNIFYPRWWDGREYKTDEYKNPTTVERTAQQTWSQRPCSDNIHPCWYPPDQPTQLADPNSDYAPDRTPFECQVSATWLATSQTATQLFAYDRYNNRTDEWEYDYNAGPAPAASCAASAPAGFKRHTVSSYKTDGTYDGLNRKRLRNPS